MLKLFVFFLFFVGSFQFVFADISIKIRKYDKYGKDKEIFVKDNFWEIPIQKAPKFAEQDAFSVVVSGYESSRVVRKLFLKGISFSQKNFLVATDTKLEIINKENFKKYLIIYQDKSQKEELSVDPHASQTNTFSEPGEYEIVDRDYPWNRVHISVLEKSSVFTIKSPKTFLKIKDIQPGTYSLKIYFGKNWIYQEEFTVMSNSNLSFVYKIKNNEVFRQDVSSTSSNKIEFRKNINSGKKEILKTKMGDEQ